MRARPAAAAALLLTLAACETEPKPEENLTLACQLVQCVCVATDAPFLMSKEVRQVEWLENGDASCPEGFELQRDTEDK